MKPKLDKGGIYSKNDLAELTPGERAAATQNEKAVALVDEAKDEARRGGGGGDFFQAFDKSETEALDNSAIISTEYANKQARELADDAARPLRMIANDPSSPFGFTWVLTERDAAAVNEWRRCPHCLQPSSSQTNSQCDWLYKKAGIKGCGYNRIAERFFDEHGASAS